MRTRSINATLLVGLLAASPGTSACASRGDVTPSLDRNVITAEEAETVTGASTAYDIVSHLRPEFLRGRGRSSGRTTRPDLPIIYFDNVRLGGVGQLRTIPAQSVETIVFISAADATTRWGTGHTGGAIEVRTRPRS